MLPSWKILLFESEWFLEIEILFKMTFSVIFDRFSFIKYLFITTHLGNVKHLVIGKLLVDTNHFSVGKHLIETKHFTSMKIWTDLTDLTIYENSKV